MSGCKTPPPQKELCGVGSTHFNCFDPRLPKEGQEYYLTWEEARAKGMICTNIDDYMALEAWIQRMLKRRGN